MTTPGSALPSCHPCSKLAPPVVWPTLHYPFPSLEMWNSGQALTASGPTGNSHTKWDKGLARRAPNRGLATLQWPVLVLGWSLEQPLEMSCSRLLLPLCLAQALLATAYTPACFSKSGQVGAFLTSKEAKKPTMLNSCCRLNKVCCVTCMACICGPACKGLLRWGSPCLDCCSTAGGFP